MPIREIVQILRDEHGFSVGYIEHKHLAYPDK
jgi:hypothetical protein